MCFSMPAGLGIYWIASAVVRTIQQLIINKFLSKKSMDELIEENVKKQLRNVRKKMPFPEEKSMRWHTRM